MSVGDFFREIPCRIDGWVLMISVVGCFLMLTMNVVGPADFQGLVASPAKWIALWATWPICLLVIYVRLRSLFDGDGLIVVVVHAVVDFGGITFFGLKNVGVL